MKNKLKKKSGREENIGALISWQVTLVLFVIMCLFVVAQYYIVTSYFNQPFALVGTLSYYIVGSCLLLALVIGAVWRFWVIRPLKRVTSAARKVASGDFSVKIEPFKGKRKKNELDILIDDFNIMTRELANNEMLKSDFISNVSHEIKTPLSVIQSYSQALKEPDIDEETYNRYVDIIISVTNNLTSMISNILKLNKLENQQIFHNSSPYQLGEQLRRCALDFVELWQAKNIDFIIEAEDLIIDYDESLLELVWKNLISNAIKYTPEGGSIQISSKKTGNAVEIVISDNGCGISEQAQKRIFDKFYQCDTSHSSEGNGLGLAIVKKVLEIVNGRISVESEVGVGTSFKVSLLIN
ncbi:MAG: HAMP domain-containing histidine kinase [Clostridia bacterium]|nr:HAMP domain-containing histidine kinase [Clostridia bacterium]